MRAVARIAASVLVALCVLSVNAQEVRVDVPGTGISMVPPAGFELRGELVGFVDPSTGASFRVAPLPPEEVDEVAAAFGSLDGLRTLLAERANIEVTGRREIVGTSGPIAIASGTFSDGGIHYRSFAAFFSSEQSAVVFVTLPPGAADEQAMLAALASLTIGPAPTLEERVASLPFVVAPAAPFRLEGTIAGRGIRLGTNEKPRSFILVSAMPTVESVPDPLVFAETTLREATGSQAVRIVNLSAVDFAGSQGFFAEGSLGPEGEGPTHILLWFAHGKQLTVVMFVGLGDAQHDRLRPSVEKTAASIALK